jgi:hypothetical protein
MFSELYENCSFLCQKRLDERPIYGVKKEVLREVLDKAELEDIQNKKFCIERLNQVRYIFFSAPIPNLPMPLKKT